MNKILDAIESIKKEYTKTTDVNERLRIINTLINFQEEIRDLREIFFSDLCNKYEYCEGCHKYLSKENFSTEKETKYYKDTPLNYSFSDDMKDLIIGDKEVELEYLVCSVCGNKRCVKSSTKKYIHNGKVLGGNNNA